MKKQILSIIFISLILCTNSKAQEPKSFIAFDNSKFLQGDSIYLGYGSTYNKEKFEYVKEYYYSSQYDKGYRRVDYRYTATKHKILDIQKDYNAIWDTSAYIITVGEEGFLKGYKLLININQAIKTGEVVLSVSPNREYNKNIPMLKDSIAFLYRLKQSQKPLIDNSIEFLYRYKNKIYEQYRQDEFELDNQKQVAAELLKKQISQLKDTTVFSLNLKLNFDNYDFSSFSFPVGGFEDGYRVIESASWGSFPTTYIVFVNQKDFSKIKVDKSIANSFIKRKKGRNGSIDRTVYAKVFFKIIEIPANSPARSTFKETSSTNFLFAEINKIEFFDFDYRTYNFIGIINK